MKKSFNFSSFVKYFSNKFSYFKIKKVGFCFKYAQLGFVLFIYILARHFYIKNINKIVVALQCNKLWLNYYARLKLKPLFFNDDHEENNKNNKD